MFSLSLVFLSIAVQFKVKECSAGKTGQPIAVENSKLSGWGREGGWSILAKLLNMDTWKCNNSICSYIQRHQGLF